jgi:hypothetical protein
MNMPGFTAEASVYRSHSLYHASAMLDGSRQAGEALVQPALRHYCSMKGCCIEFGSGNRFCCNGDECGWDLFI